MEQKLEQPFFAVLLEKQASTEDAFDGPTKPIFDMAQTQKYPSDGDEEWPILE
jgi:hypothetical protein